MLETTEKQREEIIAAEMTMQSCMEAYQEAVSAFNEALFREFDLVQEAAYAYSEACDKAEEVRKAVARSLRRKLNKLSLESLGTPEGVQAIRWVEDWENMDLRPAEAPEPPEELEEPDFPEFDQFADIPFLSKPLV